MSEPKPENKKCPICGAMFTPKPEDVEFEDLECNNCEDDRDNFESEREND